MAALTKNRKTPERIPAVRQFEAAAKICTGALVALNASGKAVPASDEDGLTVAGRAENSAVSGEMVTVKTGCFRYDNASGGAAITAADVGKVAYVADDHTVGKSSTHSIPAGIIFDVEGKGVWVEVSPAAVKAARSIESFTDTNTTYTAATADTLGLVKQAAAVADCEKAGAELTSAETQLNALLAALRTAGILAPNAEA